MVMYEAPKTFIWECHPEAENLVLKLLKEALEKSIFLQDLEKALLKETSTRLFDWIDHIEVGASSQLDQEIVKAGFERENVTPHYCTFFHPRAQLPRILIRDE